MKLPETLTGSGSCYQQHENLKARRSVKMNAAWDSAGEGVPRSV